MNAKILDFFAKVHGAYLHARGISATKKIIAVLNCHPNEKILEIGFGTGATLALLSSQHKTTRFQGIETSEKMYRCAWKRLKFCGLTGNTSLFLIKKDKPLPFADSTFDKIYAESIFAILGLQNLRELLQETFRILKPEGMFVLNETLWLKSTPRETMLKINTACQSSFGIIQANSEIPHLEDWQSFITQCGFHVESVFQVDKIPQTSPVSLSNPASALSLLYTQWGKIKLLLQPVLRKEWNMYRQQMKAILPGPEKCMEGYILVGYSRKSA